MTTFIRSAYSINGVIDTSQTALSNLNNLVTTGGAWLTYDIAQGKWAVIINTTGSSVASFNDTNILGGINVTGSGINELYNAATIEFPHKDLFDERDYVDLEIPSADRFPNELDNRLNINTELINDPIQAQQLATVELKQSRKDKIIEFRTDFTSLGLKAGDIIDVTNAQYGFTSKPFRIIRMEEADEEGLVISITALEYDSSVYDTSGLVRKVRDKKTKIKPKENNSQLQAKDDADQGAALKRLLLGNVALGLLNKFLNKMIKPEVNPTTGKKTGRVIPDENARVEPGSEEATDAEKNKMTGKELDELLGNIKKPTLNSLGGTESVCEGATVTLSLSYNCEVCLFDIPPIKYPYKISGTGITKDDINIPLTGEVELTGSSGSLSFTIANDAAAEGTEIMTVQVGTRTKTFIINDRLDFTYSTSASPTSISEGGSSTVTLTTTNVPNGTVVPYTITGATGLVTTPLSGTVTVNSNTASLVVNTTTDTVYTGNQTFTVTFNPSQADPCGQLDKTAAVTIVDDEPEPPTPPPDTTCAFRRIPLIWCPVYDGTTGEVKSMTVAKYAYVPAPYSGGPTHTVPLTVSVTQGSPSTITVLTTTTVDATGAKAGANLSVISSFNNISPYSLPTGSLVSLLGYVDG